MNIINLLELIKNQVDYTTAHKIIADFRNDFAAEYKKARYTKGTAKKAIEKYILAANYKDEKMPGVYATPATILITSGKETIKGTETTVKSDLSKITVDMMQNRRPAECYLIDSITLYKLLKKQDNKTYYLRVGNHYYNPDLIETMLQCVASDKNSYITIETCQNGALFIAQNGVAALILPYIWEKVNIAQNVNIRDFMDYTNEIEDNLLNNELKSA